MPRLPVLLLLALALPAAAQNNPSLAQALAQLRGLDEAAALQSLEQARRWPRNTAHDLALIHLYEGLAHAGMAHEELAEQSFRTALLLEPELTLPAGSSPRVTVWFEQAGGRRPVPLPPALPAVPPPPVARLAEPEPREAPSPAVRKAPRVRWGAWSLVGGGALAAGAGALVGRSARQQSSEARADAELSSSLAHQTSAENRALGANLLYAGGAALALAGGVLLLW